MKNNILELPNFVDSEICKTLINRFQVSDSKVPSSSVEDYFSDARETSVLNISENSNWKEEDEVIFGCFNSAVSDYLEHFDFKQVNLIDNGYLLHEYPIGHGCKEHSDAGSHFLSRLLTGIIFLNNVEVGGELVFPSLDITIKCEEGKLVIFPSHFTYRHLVKEVESNNKYIIVTFFSAQ